MVEKGCRAGSEWKPWGARLGLSLVIGAPDHYIHTIANTVSQLEGIVRKKRRLEEDDKVRCLASA